MIEVELPNGSIAEFPEGMSNEDIQAVLQKQFGGQQGRPANPKSLNLPKDPFEGLDPETVKSINDRFPLRGKTGVMSTFGMPLNMATADPAIQADRGRAARLEQIRLINPTLAIELENTGKLDSFLIGSGRGLTNVARGLGLADQEDPQISQAVEGLKTQQPLATGGEVVGETAPFLAVGGPIASLGRTTATKALASGVLGGTEANILARGQGASEANAAKSAVIGFGLGGMVPVVSSRFSGQTNGRLIEEGRRLLRQPSQREINRGIAESAPSVDELRQVSTQIYRNLRESGTTVSPMAYSNLYDSALNSASQIGFRQTPAARRLTPQASGVFDVMEEMAAGRAGIADIEDIRRAAQNAASVAGRAGNNQDAAINGAIVESIDDFMSRVSVRDVTGGPTNAGAELALARNLWGKARKQELIDEVIGVGEARAAGAERGIRNEINNLLNNRRRSRFFTEAERDALREVVTGTPTANTFRRLGQMGFGRGQQTSALNGMVGAGVGSSALNSVFGPAGAVIGLFLLPTVGNISKSMAERLTRNNAQFAGQLIRAGTDSRRIVNTYLRSVPAAERSAEDLSQLLMRPDVDLATRVDNVIGREAMEIARRQRRQAAVGTAGALTAAPIAAEEGSSK